MYDIAEVLAIEGDRNTFHAFRIKNGCNQAQYDDCAWALLKEYLAQSVSVTV